MKFSLLKLFALVSLLVGASTMPTESHSLEELEKQLLNRESYVEIVNRVAPPFQLSDTRGQLVHLNDYRGKVVVLTFIFATCTDACPLHTQKVIEIQKMINATPMKGLVEFVGITTDPVQDTPELLKDYIDNQGIDSANWKLLTSGSEQPLATRTLAEQYGLKFTPTSDGQQVHGVVTHLIDKEGRLRARYHGLKFENVNFVLQANALVNDFDKHDGIQTVPNGNTIVRVGPERLGGKPNSQQWLKAMVPIGLVLLSVGFIILLRSRRREG